MPELELTLMNDVDTDADVQLSEDVDSVVMRAEQAQILCDAVCIMDEYGSDPVSMRMLGRAGLLQESSLTSMSTESLFSGTMSSEGLSGLVDDAGKAVLHAAGGHSGEVGYKILKRSVDLEKAAVAAEKRLLDKLVNANSDTMEIFLQRERQGLGAHIAKTGSDDGAYAAGEAAKQRAAKFELGLLKYDLTPAEQEIIESTKGGHFQKWLALSGHRRENQYEAIRKAEEALEEATTRANDKHDAISLKHVKAAIARVKEARAEYAKSANASAEGIRNGSKVLSAKNVIIALTAAAAVTAGVKMLFNALPAADATVQAKNAYFGKIVSWVKGIHLPWAKLDVNDRGKLLVNGSPVKGAASAAEEAAAKAAEAKSPGWTKAFINQAKDKVTGLGDSIKSAFGGISGKFGHLSNVGEEAAHAATAQTSTVVQKATNVFAKSSRIGMVMALIGLIGAVIYFVVIGGMRLAGKSLDAQY